MTLIHQANVHMDFTAVPKIGAGEKRRLKLSKTSKNEQLQIIVLT